MDNNTKLICLALIVILIFVTITNNINPKILLITQGPINTILILAIITLCLQENINIGFLVAIIYLVLLTRNTHKNQNENFESISGPSPLSCSTYKKNKMNVQYPLHY